MFSATPDYPSALFGFLPMVAVGTLVAPTEAPGAISIEPTLGSVTFSVAPAFQYLSVEFELRKA